MYLKKLSSSFLFCNKLITALGRFLSFKFLVGAENSFSVFIEIDSAREKS